jgi:hypothetical protein
MLYFSKHKNEPSKMKEFFTDLERLAAVLMIIRADVNDRIERYGRLLLGIEENVDFSKAESVLQLTADEKRATIDTLNGDLYTMKRIRQYILLRLDSILSGGEASYDYPIISIEHVLPQNPSEGSIWSKWFPNEDQRQSYVHRLGNLVLLSRKKNSEAQNYDFETKKEKYFATRRGVSPFALTSQVLQRSEWTPAIIEQRQQDLTQRLTDLWRLQ